MKKKTPTFFAGRLWLVIIFLVLRGVDFCLLFTTLAVNKGPIFAAILNANLWCIVLLIAIWCRQAWARYVMVILCFGVVGMEFIFSGKFGDFFAGKNNMLILGSIAGGYLISALILILSPSVGKLTSHAFE